MNLKIVFYLIVFKSSVACSIPFRTPRLSQHAIVSYLSGLDAYFAVPGPEKTVKTHPVRIKLAQPPYHLSLRNLHFAAGSNAFRVLDFL
jgi:hypothetical protein